MVRIVFAVATSIFEFEWCAAREEEHHMARGTSLFIYILYTYSHYTERISLDWCNDVLADRPSWPEVAWNALKVIHLCSSSFVMY